MSTTGYLAFSGVLSGSLKTVASMTFSFGPPSIVQPATELLANALLDAERYGEAVSTYERQLKRTPRRAQSLMGLAKAQQGAGMVLGPDGRDRREVPGNPAAGQTRNR